MRRRVMLESKKPDANTLLLLHAEDFTDSSMHSRPVVNYNNYTTLLASGKFGRAFNVNKSYARLEVTSLKLPNTKFSIEGWFYLLANTYGVLISNNTGSLEIGIDSGKFRCVKEYVELIAIDTDTLPLNTWVHFYVDVFNNTLKGYVNGIMKFSKAVNLSQGSGMYIGNQVEEPGKYYLRGYMDEIRVSDVQRWTSNFTPPTKPY